MAKAAVNKQERRVLVKLALREEVHAEVKALAARQRQKLGEAIEGILAAHVKPQAER